MPRQQRVVLVDENSVWRKNIKAMLTKADLMVIGEAEDGITGLKLIRSRQPDIVLTEAMLPGMTGLELASIVHGDKLAPVIILCNAYYQDLLVKAVSAHVYGFLVKPVDEHQWRPRTTRWPRDSTKSRTRSARRALRRATFTTLRAPSWMSYTLQACPAV